MLYFFPCKIRVINNLRSFVAKPVFHFRDLRIFYVETNLAQHFVCGVQMTNVMYDILLVPIVLLFSMLE